MTGESDLYIRARRVLLDALAALRPHNDSVVLVGAQAVYLHTGGADMAIELYTKDADVVLDPTSLAASPDIGSVLRSEGFESTTEPGRWMKDEIPVDLMVPEALAGPARRGAELGTHGRTIARRARGLEGALIDKGIREVASLDPADQRKMRVAVAGPAALLIAKLHKISERAARPDRLQDKDALDVLRILRTAMGGTLVAGLGSLQASDLARETTNEGIVFLRDLFGRATSGGALAAARALEGLEDEATVVRSCEALVDELLEAGLEVPDL